MEQMTGILINTFQFACIASITTGFLYKLLYNELSKPKCHGKWVEFIVSGKHFRVPAIVLCDDVVNIVAMGFIGNKYIDIYTNIINGSVYGLPYNPGCVGFEGIKLTLHKKNGVSDVMYFGKDENITIERRRPTFISVED